MAAEDSDDNVTVELSSADLLKALGLLRWNTFWTSMGAIAGWVALAFVLVTVLTH